jgi:hypothetical protein
VQQFLVDNFGLPPPQGAQRTIFRRSHSFLALSTWRLTAGTALVGAGV